MDVLKNVSQEQHLEKAFLYLINIVPLHSINSYKSSKWYSQGQQHDHKIYSEKAARIVA